MFDYVPGYLLSNKYELEFKKLSVLGFFCLCLKGDFHARDLMVKKL